MPVPTPPDDAPGVALTEGHLLGGRVRYAQPRHGFRSGIEPVLLAASLPAEPGQRVLEGGSGAGATLLCLAARVAGVTAVGIEQDAGLVELARYNVQANGWTGLAFVTATIEAPVSLGLFDHACANPPYHLAAGTSSPERSRRAAKQGGVGLLAVWAVALAAHLRPHGTLTFILPAARMPDGLAAFAAAGCRPAALLPFWPREETPAKLVLLRGIKDRQGPFQVLPGLVLHAPGKGFTPEAEAILRDGASLVMRATGP